MKNGVYMEEELKTLTANSIKWNLVDKFATQILYAVTGIVLACILPYDDFGLVGAILIFQAFASLFIDSGFSSALIQRKSPTDNDYSTVLWFNLGVATLIYALLWFSAPFIATLFQNDTRLIPLSRVMFLSFILNASAIVQTNRLMKVMNIKPIAITNSIGLIAGGVCGIYLALNGYGAWSIVWQTVVTAATKSVLLWISNKWVPYFSFSFSSLKSFFKVGSGVMVTSFLNTVFLNIFSFFIGNRLGMAQLGYYTQADKWSKMGIMSVSQTLTSAFLPTLSSVQDNEKRFKRAVTKMNKFTAYILFPTIVLLCLLAEPVFHTLFGTKWDMSIVLFQLLLIRGIFTILIGLYSNYLLSLAKTKLIMTIEIVKDSISLTALFLTLPMLAVTYENDIVFGIKVMLWGQIFAALITYIIALSLVCKHTNFSLLQFMSHNVPYISLSVISMIFSYPIVFITNYPIILCALHTIVFASIYLLANKLLKSQIQNEVLSYIFKTKMK